MIYRFLVFFIFFISISSAQNIYPQDYFINPLDINVVLSGSFGELRSNHFHSGLDIKTRGKEGLNVKASAAGYVSRIKLAHFGYGKAVYVTHPNGYTTVYAHLQNLSPKLNEYVKKRQYEKETYEIELFPKKTDLVLEQGEAIGLSGNTGSSGGPHLHFEIRDNAERPVNPMLFGIRTKDTKKPNIKGFYAYPLNDTSYVNGFNSKQKLRAIPLKNGDFKIEDLTAYGEIGFGVISTDKHDLAGNNNGVYFINTLVNGETIFEANFKRVSFAESKHINRYIDFEHYKDKKKKIQKLFKDSNNPLSIYSNLNNNGILKVKHNTSQVYTVNVGDFDDNITQIKLNIVGDANMAKKDVSNDYKEPNVVFNEIKEFSDQNISVTIPKNTFYDNTFIDFKVSSDTVHLLPKNKALKKRITVTFDITNYKDKDLNGLYIAELVGWNNFPSYSKTKRIGNILYTTTKTLGTYTLNVDEEPPTITPLNFTDGKWMSNFRFLKVKIEDKLTGIKSYKATINGKFFLMEYDYKKKTLIHDFNDNVVTDTKNNLKIIVTDNVGNSTTFETTFFRK